MPAEDSLLFLRDLADVEPPRELYKDYDKDDIYKMVPQPQWTGLEEEVWTPRERENDPQPRDRSDRSRVEHDRTKPVGRMEQVYSMKQQRVDVSDSTGEDSEGDATGRRVLQQQREHRSKSRGKSASRQGKSRDRARSARTQILDGSDGDDSEHVGSVRTKYGVQIKVDKVNMDKFADFDNMVRSQTRDGRRATRSGPACSLRRRA